MIEPANIHDLTVRTNPKPSSDGANQFSSFQLTLQSMEEEFLRRAPKESPSQQGSDKHDAESQHVRLWARATTNPTAMPVSAPSPAPANTAATSPAAAVSRFVAGDRILPVKTSSLPSAAWSPIPAPRQQSGELAPVDSVGPADSAFQSTDKQYSAAQTGCPAGIHLYTVADGVAFSLRTGQDSSTATMLAAWIRQRLQARGIYVAESHVDGVARHYLPQPVPTVNKGK